ncbi:siderophore-interacting protein [Vibrio sp. STUT-A11]|uniref:siderophore-interacting protein n=1 Tax=Vibrio sp. STUT-A11 TaxID=2976236 RepID=UPI00222E8CDF|nr:siderophore-interacting protein [Vibrio sp. STUT-A11]BDR16644.1 vibriobactin utilization protein ViuB [Vibrio sp. STUT-A11]
MSEEIIYPIKPRLLTVKRKQYLTPHLIRVTFGGDDLIGFPENRNGGHIKVFFPNQESGILQLPIRYEDRVEYPEHKPVPRAYSVRKYHHESNELDIDFVAHGEGSPGSGWAINAQEGDQLGVLGPGGPDPLLQPSDWHILAGDLTAVAAISAILEELPEYAKGAVFIEVCSFDDVHEIKHPTGVSLNWLKIDDEQPAMTLLNGIKMTGEPEEVCSVSAFIAGENRSVINCRKYLSDKYKLKKQSLYAIPYWKRGNTEEAYHQERHRIMDEQQ